MLEKRPIPLFIMILFAIWVSFGSAFIHILPRALRVFDSLHIWYYTEFDLLHFAIYNFEYIYNKFHSSKDKHIFLIKQLNYKWNLPRLCCWCSCELRMLYSKHAAPLILHSSCLKSPESFLTEHSSLTYHYSFPFDYSLQCALREK